MSDQDKQERFGEKSEVDAVLPLSSQDAQNEDKGINNSKTDEKIPEQQMKEDNYESNATAISNVDKETTIETNDKAVNSTNITASLEQSNIATAAALDEINSLILSPLRQLSSNPKGTIVPPVIGLSMKNSKFSINRELDLSHFEVGVVNAEIRQPVEATATVAAVKVLEQKSSPQEISHSEKDFKQVKSEQDKGIEGQIETLKNNNEDLNEQQEKQNNYRDREVERKKEIEESKHSQEDEGEKSKVKISQERKIQEESNIISGVQNIGESTSTNQDLAQQHDLPPSNSETSKNLETLSPSQHLISYTEKEQICDQVINSSERQIDTKSQDSDSSQQQIDVSTNNNNNNIINNCSHVTPTYAAPIHEKELVLRVMSIVDGMATLMSDDLSSVHMPLLFLPTPISCGSILRLYIDTDTSLQQTQINNIIQIQQDILHNQNYLQNH